MATRRAEPSEAPAEPVAVKVDEVIPAATRPPRSRETLSAEERRKYSSALDRGRRLHGEEDYDGAIEAYGDALALLPDDPRTLSELGWAQIFAGVSLCTKSTRRFQAVSCSGA